MWKLVSMVMAVLILQVLTSEAASLKKERRRRDNSKNCPEDCKSKPLEISFVVDGSASIWAQNFTLGLNFIEDFVDGFDISPSAVRVSLVTFGERVYDEDSFGFADYTSNDALTLAVSNVPYKSGVMTNTSGGIWYMLHNQKPEVRNGVRHVAIVMTDGNSQETQLTKQAAKDARDAGMEVFAIGIGQQVSAEELHNIASDDKHVFVVASYGMLEGIKRRLAYSACDKPSYPEKCETDPVDLSFVIDSSASIGEGNFTVGMQFVKDFVDSFDVSPKAVRISVVTFGEIVYEQDAFDFDDYHDKKTVLDSLSAIVWRHGVATNTGAGIEYMRDFQMAKARPQAAHVCIVITDGQSQEFEKTRQEAERAQGEGIVMYAIGVGELGVQLDEQELNNIAGDPSRVVTANNYGQLNLIKDSLTSLTCSGILESLSAKWGN